MLEKSSFLSSFAFRGIAVAAVSSTLFACVIEDAPPRRLGPDDRSYSPPATGTGTVGGTPTTPPTTTTPTSPSPMLVSVDTDQVMNADPGQGVGIFTEYGAGGKWHIWWTCDTAVSKQQCDVSLAATAATGTIDALNSDALQGTGTVATPDPTRVEVHVTTTDQVHGITFTSTPGAVVTLEATVGGLTEGPGTNHSFFFFVQNGKINGGYTGPLTNPLQLQGSKP